MGRSHPWRERGYRRGPSHDSKTAVGRIPALFPKIEPEDRQAPQSRYRQSRCRGRKDGAGKTTLFWMISGQEPPDEGQVSLDRGITIGYFSQDVGEMSGRSAVAEVMDGAGPVSIVAAELKELETAMADPDRADDMDEIITRYGQVHGRFEELDGYSLD